MDIFRELALRTDPEVQQALNRMLKGASTLDPTLGVLFESPTAMKNLVESVQQPSNLPNLPVQDLGQEPRAVRAALILAAEDPTLRPALEAALVHDRGTREPLTIALALAGIVLVLSTSFEVNFDRNGDSKKFSFQVKRDAAPPEILKKFFGLFGGG